MGDDLSPGCVKALGTVVLILAVVSFVVALVCLCSVFRVF
jgi:hypothetical protein